MRIPFLIFLAFLLSCQPSAKKGSGTAPGSSEDASPSVTSFEGASGLLISQLRLQGDYVNSRQYPSMIKPSTLNDEMDGNHLVLDLRDPALYARGHITDAVNVEMNDLLSFFEGEILPFKFDKIILVSESGQVSSYATNLLRLMGYGNVYSMRWGMCGWHSDFSGDLLQSYLSSDYQDHLVRETPPGPRPVNQPPLVSTASNGELLLRERVLKSLSVEPGDIFIHSDELFGNLDDYFIINLERKDKYDSGHIPGSYRYKKQGMLGIPSVMATLPVDKPIVLYCGTGMSSAFAAAYLRLFGYDARSLYYGNNSFMHQKMLDERDQLSWQPYTPDIPGEYSYVRGN
jgi:rhodanese-related sulfurtransferase